MRTSAAAASTSSSMITCTMLGISKSSQPRRALGRAIPAGLFGVGLVLQTAVGPACRVMERVGDPRARLEDRAWKAEWVRRIPPDAPVTASMGFLSHLAARADLRSAHHILKGLGTLSRVPFESVGGGEPRAVLIDHADPATFDVAAGFYHPRMRTVTGQIVPSSDQLWHEHLRSTPGCRELRNTVGFILPGSGGESRTAVAAEPGIDLGIAPGLGLEGPARLGLPALGSAGAGVELRWDWVTTPDREALPWLTFVLAGPGGVFAVPGGLAAPGLAGGREAGRWRIDLPGDLPPGDYQAVLLFHREDLAVLDGRRPPRDRTHEIGAVSLGGIRVEAGRRGTPGARD